ncbi:MAG: hypothetical protein HKN82_12245, partial [Akkermansiaceae bacterium]|nr:hypothetical protein [Akkermansiaceae bacterium]
NIVNGEVRNRTAELAPDVGSFDFISSFGEDALGNLYIVDMGNLGTPDGQGLGEVFRIDGPGPVLAITGFSYDASSGSAELSFTGHPCAVYKLTEAGDLGFSTPAVDPVPLTGATVGTLSGNEVTTDASGHATVQFNLGNVNAATFVRVESP